MGKVALSLASPGTSWLHLAVVAKRYQDRAPLGPTALLGLLLAETPEPRIPARPWPVAAACAVLAKVGQDLEPRVHDAAKSGGARGERKSSKSGYAHSRPMAL